MFPPLPVLYRQLRQEHHSTAEEEDGLNIKSQLSIADMDEEPDQLNSIETPYYLHSYRTFVNRFMNYRRGLMVEEGGACNFNDVLGHCGENFPLHVSNEIKSDEDG